jgi:hypothetical protein
MRCKGMKTGPVKNKFGIVPSSSRTKNCGRPATVFFRVRYSELFRHCDNGVYEDVLGFCEECAKDKDKPSGYQGSSNSRWTGRKILHLRGEIASVEPDDGSTVADEHKIKRMHDGKRELLKIMSWKGNSDLADSWEDIMDLAIKEFTISRVHTA